MEEVLNAIQFASVSAYASWCRANRGDHGPLVHVEAFVRVDDAAIPGYSVPPEIADEWRRMTLGEARYWVLFARGYRMQDFGYATDA